MEEENQVGRRGPSEKRNLLKQFRRKVENNLKQTILPVGNNIRETFRPIEDNIRHTEGNVRAAIDELKKNDIVVGTRVGVLKVVKSLSTHTNSTVEKTRNVILSAGIALSGENSDSALLLPPEMSSGSETTSSGENGDPTETINGSETTSSSETGAPSELPEMEDNVWYKVLCSKAKSISEKCKPYGVRWVCILVNIFLELGQAVATQTEGDDENKGKYKLNRLVVVIFSSICLILSLFEVMWEASKGKLKWQQYLREGCNLGRFFIWFGLISATVQFSLNMASFVRNKDVLKFDIFALLLSVGYFIAAVVHKPEATAEVYHNRGELDHSIVDIDDHPEMLSESVAGHGSLQMPQRRARTRPPSAL